MSAASVAFKITYNALYILLYLVLLLLLLVIPTDIIRQAVDKSQKYNILVVALCYVVTVLVVAFIYATRLYINRSVLASIPKSYIPVDKGDVSKNVRKMIVAGLSRSAAIAYMARPRVEPVILGQQQDLALDDAQSIQAHDEKKSMWDTLKVKKTTTSEGPLALDIAPRKPVWGDVEHFGWASPLSPDLPNLQYSSVISELPNLIEAKALTLAPPDPNSVADPPLLDAESVVLLQRDEHMGLRDYLAYLDELRVLEATPTVSAFVTEYESARFSGKPLSNARFRELMALFAEILRSMQQLDPAVIKALDDSRSGSDDSDTPAPHSDIDDDGPQGSNPATPPSRARRRSRPDPQARAVSRSSTTTSGSSVAGPRRPKLQARTSSGVQQFRTAPTTPKSRHTAVSRSSSENTFAQSRQPYSVASQASSSSNSVIRSGGEVEEDDGDAGSVIRLSRRTTER